MESKDIAPKILAFIHNFSNHQHSTAKRNKFQLPPKLLCKWLLKLEVLFGLLKKVINTGKQKKLQLPLFHIPKA